RHAAKTEACRTDAQSVPAELTDARVGVVQASRLRESGKLVVRDPAQGLCRAPFFGNRAESLEVARGGRATVQLIGRGEPHKGPQEAEARRIATEDARSAEAEGLGEKMYRRLASAHTCARSRRLGWCGDEWLIFHPDRTGGTLIARRHARRQPVDR